MADKVRMEIAGVKTMVLDGETVKADKDGFFNLTEAQAKAALPFTRKPVRIQNSMQGYRVPKPNNMAAKPVVAPVAAPAPVAEAPKAVEAKPGRKGRKGRKAE